MSHHDSGLTFNNLDVWICVPVSYECVVFMSVIIFNAQLC